MENKAERFAKEIHLLKSEKEDLKIMAIKLGYGDLKNMIQVVISSKLREFKNPKGQLNRTNGKG